MKRIFTFLAVAVMALAVVSLTSSCKKDIETAKSLAGTTWYNVSFPQASVVADVYTLKFTSQSKFELDMTGSKTLHGSGTFIVSGSNVVFSFNQSVFDWIDWTSGGELLYANGVIDRVTINGYVFSKEMPKIDPEDL